MTYERLPIANDPLPAVSETTAKQLAVADAQLPKWPQMILVGEPVDVETAFDIILRTDRFLSDVLGTSGGNAKRFNGRYAAALTANTGIDLSVIDWADRWTLQESVRRALGYVDLEYVYNRWASSAYVFGPAGFVSPEGALYFAENLGKYPSAATVLDDLRKIARAWPVISAKATLYSGEQSEPGRQPVISFELAEGEARVIDLVDLRGEQPKVFDEGGQLVDEFEAKMAEHLHKIGGLAEGRELGLPNDWYTRAAAHVNNLIVNLQQPRIE